MTSTKEAAIQYARENRERYLDTLQEWVRIPSISTDPEAKDEMERAAKFAADQMRAMGLEHVQIYPTKGNPMVYGDWLKTGKDKPTVLMYGHYDVQPPDPLELWQTEPFEPTRKGDYLYGRGTSDMKGQVIASLKAVEALLRTGGLPVNVKFILEGEEEIGSSNMDRFLEGHKELLSADFAFNPDTGMLGPRTPTITYGLRGMAYFEIRLAGPNHDLHSGLFGGAVHNPAQVLCELIAGMHDERGRVTLPGYYDSVRPLEEDERAELARLPIDEEFYLKGSGAPALYGEQGYTAVERVAGRPTLEVNGLLSGFTGEGQKTVLPAKAIAKVSMRLVPDQDPEEVKRQLEQYLDERVPETVHYELIQMSSNPASMVNRDTPWVKALQQALQETWGERPLFKREGGSVPVVGLMQKHLGIDSVCTGFSLPDDNLHAPNERFHLPTFYNGIEATIRFLSILGG